MNEHGVKKMGIVSLDTLYVDPMVVHVADPIHTVCAVAAGYTSKVNPDLGVFPVSDGLPENWLDMDMRFFAVKDYWSSRSLDIEPSRDVVIIGISFDSSVTKARVGSSPEQFLTPG